MFNINLVKLSIKLGVPVSAAIVILGGALFIVYESMLAWGVFGVCLGSGIIFFLITARAKRYSRLQAVSSIVALGLLIASVVALLLAI